jgi:hypothetical protein
VRHGAEEQGHRVLDIAQMTQATRYPCIALRTQRIERACGLASPLMRMTLGSVGGMAAAHWQGLWVEAASKR